MQISRLLQIIACSKAAHPEYFADTEDDKAQYHEDLLNEIESDLRDCCEDLGLPYIRPALSPDSAHLLLNSFTGFIKAYVRELRATCRGGMNFVML